MVRRMHVPVTSASGMRVIRSGLVRLNNQLIVRAMSTVLRKGIGSVPRRRVTITNRLHPTPGVFGRAYQVS